MKTSYSQNPQFIDRKGERGSALVSVLLVSMLLLVAAAGIILQTSAASANVSDALAEQQAYNAAESGIQAAINALRRGTVPSPLKDATKPATHQSNQLDYVGAITLASSNRPDDPANVARLSRWLPYNYTPPGDSFPDRVAIGAGTYDPRTGLAYSVAVTDPDNPQKIISISTSASIDGGGSSKTFGLPLLGQATISFESATSGAIDVSTREAGVKLGTFIITKSGFGDVTLPNDVSFEIMVRMTAPLSALVKLRGKIKKGTISATSVGNVRFALDAPVTPLLGSAISIPTTTIIPNAPNVNGGRTDIGTNLGVTISLSQPRRLQIRSVGYGPRGARKVIEAVVQRDNFDGLIPATVALVGNLTGAIFNSSATGGQDFAYSGSDAAGSGAKIAPIGVIGGSGGGLLSGILNLGGGLCVGCLLNGTPAEFSNDETPDFLQSSVNLNAKIMELKDNAMASDRYYPSGTPPPNFGNNADGTGITYIDGDANLTGSGGGILVVTGKLNLSNSFDFNGTIFAVGSQGVKRIGSGTGTLQGNLVVAPYNLANPSAGFLPPKYDVTGGLANTLIYNASNLLFGSNNYSTVVIAVAEK